MTIHVLFLSHSARRKRLRSNQAIIKPSTLKHPNRTSHSFILSTEAEHSTEAPPIPKRRRSTPSRFCKRGRIGAPLASTETLSPSLASSFCSQDIIFFDDQSSCHGDMDESSYSQVPSLCLQPSPVPSHHSGGHSV